MISPVAFPPELLAGVESIGPSKRIKALRLDVAGAVSLEVVTLTRHGLNTTYHNLAAYLDVQRSIECRIL